MTKLPWILGILLAIALMTWGVVWAVSWWNRGDDARHCVGDVCFENEV